MHSINAPKILQPYASTQLIRLGKCNDGGYLVQKEDVLNSSKLVSIGIGEDWSFEEQFLQINDCDFFAYDETVATNSKKYKDFFYGRKHHFAKNVGDVTKGNIDLEEILEGNNIFLKCDIEGAEYNLFNTIIKHSHKITGIVIEVHNIDNNFNTLFNFIYRLKQKIVHTHVNNYFYYKTDRGNIPDILELTFSSSSNIIYDPNLKLPHELDMPNNPNDMDFQLIFE